ncbi:hypothetical protein M4I32_01235 [Microbacterium sp. LRZ72]|uniref:hypothetical protein n=1 Tax=Microbacterium sp. LRZ72 TaxID=2942481 RepID=UPI0029AC23F0|nr:hypothetical protein [Microbacterium sp. LRZ72]MDX2375424.1 hypothetical protein [Microbacterium sp. LRZ72]
MPGTIRRGADILRAADAVDNRVRRATARYRERMGRRLPIIVAIAGVLALAACAPETSAAPSPAPSVSFATDAEAFAAAEATYRAYVDALNQVDLSDPETFEAVYAWTTGDANANAREYLSALHASGSSVSGDSVVATFDAVSENESAVVGNACLDVRDVQLRDADGDAIVSPSRPDVQSFQVSFIPGSDGLLISAFEGGEASTCALLW